MYAQKKEQILYLISYVNFTEKVVAHKFPVNKQMKL